MGTRTVEQHSPKPLKWWFDNRHLIDTEPFYQRKSDIWPKPMRAFLIDTILNGYDIPKFYLADFRRSSGSLNPKGKTYAIIDGKQRFEAIFDFFDDKLALAKDFVLESEPTLDLGGRRYSDLARAHPALRRQVDEYELTVMSVVTDEPGVITNLFLRLNRGLALTGAEQRNAAVGTVPALIRDLAGHEFFSSRVKFSTLRGADNNTAAKLLLVEHRAHFADTKKKDLDNFVKETDLQILGDDEPFRQDYERAVAVLDRMVDAFVPRDPLLAASGIVPVYYWFFRTHNTDSPERLREFLDRFNSERAANNALAAQDPVAADSELLMFEHHRRSPNDRRAAAIVYDILDKRFRLATEAEQ